MIQQLTSSSQQSVTFIHQPRHSCTNLQAFECVCLWILLAVAATTRSLCRSQSQSTNPTSKSATTSSDRNPFSPIKPSRGACKAVASQPPTAAEIIITRMHQHRSTTRKPVSPRAKVRTFRHHTAASPSSHSQKLDSRAAQHSK